MSRPSRAVLASLVAVTVAAASGSCTADGSEPRADRAPSSTTAVITATSDDEDEAEPLAVTFFVVALDGGPTDGLVGSGPEPCVGDPTATTGKYRTWTGDAEVRILDELDAVLASKPLGPGEALAGMEDIPTLRCDWDIDLGPVPEASFYALEIAGQVVHTFDGGDRRAGELRVFLS